MQRDAAAQMGPWMQRQPHGQQRQASNSPLAAAAAAKASVSKTGAVPSGWAGPPQTQPERRPSSPPPDMGAVPGLGQAGARVESMQRGGLQEMGVAVPPAARDRAPPLAAADSGVGAPMTGTNGAVVDVPQGLPDSMPPRLPPLPPHQQQDPRHTTRPVGPLAAGIQRMASNPGIGSSTAHQLSDAAIPSAAEAANPAIAGPPLHQGAAVQAVSKSMESQDSASRPSGAASTALGGGPLQAVPTAPPASGAVATAALPGWVAPFASVGTVRRSGRWQPHPQADETASLPHGMVAVDLGVLMPKGFSGIRSPLKAASQGPARYPHGYITTGGKRQVPEPSADVSGGRQGTKLRHGI